MAEWEADEQGYILVSPIGGFALAIADGAVLLQLRLEDPHGSEPQTVQLALTPEQACDLGRALTQTGEETRGKPDSGSQG